MVYFMPNGVIEIIRFDPGLLRAIGFAITRQERYEKNLGLRPDWNVGIGG
jgi:hypothetical protein